MSDTAVAEPGAPSGGDRTTDDAGKGGDGSLKHRLGTASIVFTVMAYLAPLGAAAGYVPFVVGYGNGLGAPYTFLLCGALVVLFSFGYLAMVRHVPRPGAFYAYISTGLGKRLGLAAGSMTLMFYILTAVGFTIFGSVSMQSVLAANLGVDLPWWLYAIGQVALVGLCGYRGIEFSTRILGIVVALELLLIMAFNVVTFFQGGPSGLSAQPFTWDSLTSGSITAAVLFAVAFFVGFESTAIFREEAKAPERTIPRATIIVTAVIAVFYFVTAYCFIIGLGAENAVDAAATDPAGSFVTAVTGALGNTYAQVVSVMIVTSSVAAQLAMVTVTTRYIYSFSVDGVIPKALSVIHKRHNAPSRAALATIGLTAFGVLAVAVSGIDATRAYGTFSGVLEFGFEVLVLLVSAAVIVYFLRHRGTGESVWSTFIAPGLSILIWGWLLFASLANAELLLGTPTPLTNVIIALLTVAFIGGFVFASWAAVRRPQVYARIGRETV